MPLPSCAVCERPFDPATSDALPFCCKRCQLIDLGRWLGEEHSVPYDRPPDDEGFDDGFAGEDEDR